MKRIIDSLADIRADLDRRLAMRCRFYNKTFQERKMKATYNFYGLNAGGHQVAFSDGENFEGEGDTLYPQA
jgi:hypothetical protein